MGGAVRDGAYGADRGRAQDVGGPAEWGGVLERRVLPVFGQRPQGEEEWREVSRCAERERDGRGVYQGGGRTRDRVLPHVSEAVPPLMRERVVSYVNQVIRVYMSRSVFCSSVMNLNHCIPLSSGCMNSTFFFLELPHRHHTYRVRNTYVNLQVLQEVLDGRLECTLLSGLDLGVGHVSTDSEAVPAPIKVLSPVQLRGLGASAENVVGQFLGRLGKLSVRLARVDQEGGAALLESL